MELASYDIVLTDYATLQSEFYYSNHNPTSRKLRRPSRYLNVRTPLLFVNFWRVCLDEAQMVSSVITKPAQLVAQLSAVNRWVSVHCVKFILFQWNSTNKFSVFQFYSKFDKNLLSLSQNI